MEFLLSFSTLEELNFCSRFYPHVSSSLGATGLSSTSPGSVSPSAERPLVEKFFKTVLSRHKENLRFLAFNDCDGGWSSNWERLESIFKCRRLTRLQIPICYTADHLVSPSQNFVSICVPRLLPVTPCLGTAAEDMCVVATRAPHLDSLALPTRPRPVTIW